MKEFTRVNAMACRMYDRYIVQELDENALRPVPKQVVRHNRAVLLPAETASEFDHKQGVTAEGRKGIALPIVECELCSYGPAWRFWIVRRELPRNARFWIWHNGWTKVTLRPGQKLSYGYGGPTDEGYAYGNESFELEDGIVTHIIESSAQDCDGRHYETRVMVCPVHKLRERDMAKAYDGAEKDNFGIYAPSWERISERQRDHYAESMGY